MKDGLDLSKLIAKVGLPKEETPEQVLANTIKTDKRARENPTAITYWLDAVIESGVSSPKTHIMPLTNAIQGSILNDIHNDPILVTEAEYQAAKQNIIDFVRQAGDEFGYPLFIKTSLFSAKHSWKESCYIGEDITDEEIIDHVARIIYDGAMVGVEPCADLVVREMIPTAPSFTSFTDMPIVEEYRFFTKNRKVEGFQPYWPEEAFEYEDNLPEDWQERLQKMATPSPELLKEMIDMANNVVSKLDGDWSVDFLIDKNGQPYLTDMAEAHKSYRNEREFTYTQKRPTPELKL